MDRKTRHGSCYILSFFCSFVLCGVKRVYGFCRAELSLYVCENHERMRRILNFSLYFLIGLVLLTVLAPREQSKVAFDYQKGSPWRYAPLIAPFQFPIVKSDKQIAAERDSVVRQFQPYFNRLDSVGVAQAEDFRRDFNAGKFGIVPLPYGEHVYRLLNRVYQDGVVGTDAMTMLKENNTTSIRVITGKEATSHDVFSIHSTRTAYELIMAADSSRFLREVLARCNVNDYLSPNFVYDEAKTTEERESELSHIISNVGLVEQGERIVDRGEIITSSLQQKLESYIKAVEHHKGMNDDFWIRIAGQGLFILFVLALFPMYLYIFRRDYLNDLHAIGLFFSLLILFPLTTYILLRTGYAGSILLVPFAMLPLFVRIFFDSRTATMALLVMLLLATVGQQAPLEFFLVELYMGLAATYVLRELTDRAQLFRIALFVVLGGLLMQFSIDLAQGIAPRDFNPLRYLYIFVSGVLFLFAYPLMYAVERIFGFTSSVTLVELTNINNPLMRKLSKVAQGTFNHSMQVGNLAAEVADKIGGKPQLVRTAALYHDIGKLLNPAFFTENQTGVNPHDELVLKEGVSVEEQSAEIIINHVREGVKLAEKYHLPKVLRDFIITHHGLSQVKYFFVQWQNNHPGQQPDLSKFTYPGPNPFTKEQAILMMCDAVEASSRSLAEYTEESITQLVERIVDGQIAAGYFRDCPITFKDLQNAKAVLVESLKTMYHTRIAYPELRPSRVSPPHSHRLSLLGGRFSRGGRNTSK